MAEKINLNVWTEQLTIEPEQIVKLNIGALELYLEPLKNEWQVRHGYANDDETSREKPIQLSRLKQRPNIDLELMRFIHSHQESKLRFIPRMANRSIVAKPYQPIYLPANQTVTIYISTPIWLAVKIGDQKDSLLELPSFRLSDTWFGPKPHIGELCYSSHFSGRVDLASLPRRESRIITPVKVSNQASDNLKIEKISIPCEFLEIYQNEQGELWTQELSLSRQQNKKSTKLIVDKVKHSALDQATKISEARKQDVSGLLSKTVDMLFS
jgi:hypothetical protein